MVRVKLESRSRSNGICAGESYVFVISHNQRDNLHHSMIFFGFILFLSQSMIIEDDHPPGCEQHSCSQPYFQPLVGKKGRSWLWTGNYNENKGKTMNKVWWLLGRKADKMRFELMVPKYVIFQVWCIKPLCHMSWNRLFSHSPLFSHLLHQLAFHFPSSTLFPIFLGSQEKEDRESSKCFLFFL